MAPTGRKSRRTATTTRRATTRTLDKQRRRTAQSRKQETTIVLPCNSSTTTNTTASSDNNNHPSKLDGLDFDSVVGDDNMTTTSTSGCSTPKAQRFRIPEILTCPPAPMKKRVFSNCRPSRPIAFFAPPDLELFFLFELRDVSV